MGINPTGERARGVRDQRFGMPALSTHLVQDGDQPGLWVNPEHSDPEDEFRESDYLPDPHEGEGGEIPR
jgi:hypothetical protein